MNESTAFLMAPAYAGLGTVSGKVKGHFILTCTIIPANDFTCMERGAIFSASSLFPFLPIVLCIISVHKAF